MEFLAKINGAEIKSQKKSESSGKSETSLAERLRSKLNKDIEKSAVSGQKTNFSEGVGYQVIG